MKLFKKKTDYSYYSSYNSKSRRVRVDRVVVAAIAGVILVVAIVAFLNLNRIKLMLSTAFKNIRLMRLSRHLIVVKKKKSYLMIKWIIF